MNDGMKSEYIEVSGPTPGLCLHTDRGQMCTRVIGHIGEHLLVVDTLTPTERFLETASRFPVRLRA